jgi:hypothetical protein
MKNGRIEICHIKVIKLELRVQVDNKEIKTQKCPKNNQKKEEILKKKM